MKKLLSLILALAMVLALVACGNKTTDDSNAAGNGGFVAAGNKGKDHSQCKNETQQLFHGCSSS